MRADAIISGFWVSKLNNLGALGYPLKLVLFKTHKFAVGFLGVCLWNWTQFSKGGLTCGHWEVFLPTAPGQSSSSYTMSFAWAPVSCTSSRSFPSPAAIAILMIFKSDHVTPNSLQPRWFCVLTPLCTALWNCHWSSSHIDFLSIPCGSACALPATHSSPSHSFLIAWISATGGWDPRNVAIENEELIFQFY